MLLLKIGTNHFIPYLHIHQTKFLKKLCVKVLNVLKSFNILENMKVQGFNILLDMVPTPEYCRDLPNCEQGWKETNPV